MIPLRSRIVAGLLACFAAPLAAQEPNAAAPLPPGAVARLGQANFWHGAQIRALAFSPDEKLLAALGANQRICLWEVPNGELRVQIQAPFVKEGPKERLLLTAQGPSLFFSGDGNVLGMLDLPGGVCRFWETSSGKELPAISLAYLVQEIEAPAGVLAPVAPTKRGVAGVFAIAHDGRWFAQAKEHTIHVFKPGVSEPVQKLAGDREHVVGLAFSRDGTMLAAAGDDQVIRLWNLKEAKVVGALRGHRAAVTELVFHGSGERLLSASADGSLRLWDVGTGKALVHALWKPPHLQEASADSSFTAARTVIPQIEQVWFEDDGKRLGAFYSLTFGTTGVCEDVVARFDAVTGKLLARHTVHDQRAPSSTLSSASSFASRTTVARHSAVAPVRNLLARAPFLTHAQLLVVDTGLPAISALQAGCAEVVMAGDHVALVQQGDPTVYLWKWRTAESLRKLTGHTGKPFLVGFGPDGKTLVSGSRDAADRTLSLWDVAGGAEVRQIGGWHPGIATTITSAFASRTAATAAVPMPVLSPDGKRLAFRGADGAPHVVELATGADVAKFAFTWKGDGGLEFTADGKHVVVSEAYEIRKLVLVLPAGAARAAPKREAGCHLHLFEVATGKEVGKINADSFEFHITRLLVAGSRALAGCKDGAIRIIDLDSGRVTRELWQSRLDPGRGLASTANRAPFFVASSDRRMIGLRSPDDGSIHVLEVATGKERLVLPEQSSVVTCMAFAQDSLHFVIGRQDSAVFVWGLGATGTEKMTDADRAVLWQDLGSDDTARTFAGMRRLLGDAEGTAQLLREQLRPVKAPDQELVQKHISELDSPVFTVRQKAQDDLIHLGDPIRLQIEKVAADKSTSSEAKQRIGAILKRLDTGTPTGEQLRALRAIELLERLGTKAALATLERIAAGAPAAELTREARDSMRRMKNRE